MKSELLSLAIEIFNLCIRTNISIEVEWIPREQNQTADAYSKVFDYDDWSISISFLIFSINYGVHLLATFLQIQIITRQICSFLHIGAPDQAE